MRLLLVSTVPATLNAFLLPYAEHYAARGWTVDAATAAGPVPEAVTRAFGQVHAVPWSRRPDPGGLAPVVRGLRQVLAGYDLVHTHTPVASFATRLAARSLPRARRPAVVYTAHGFHFHPGGRASRNAGFAAAERVAGRWTDHLVVLTEQDARAARRLGIVPAARLSTIAGVGIDLAHYAPTPALLCAAAAVPRELGLPAGARLFSVVANLDPGKNHVLAVRALALLDESAHLVFAGPGPMEGRLEELARRLGVRHRLHLVGGVRDVRPLLLASQAKVMPSRREGLSRAVMEAKALGVPVVGTRVRGVAELVSPASGLLIDPDDVEGTAAAMEASAGFPPPEELRRRLEPELLPLSLEVVLAQHDELYARVLDRSSAQS